MDRAGESSLNLFMPVHMNYHSLQVWQGGYGNMAVADFPITVMLSLAIYHLDDEINIPKMGYLPEYTNVSPL